MKNMPHPNEEGERGEEVGERGGGRERWRGSGRDLEREF